LEFGLNSILTFLICYLAGSFPTGYLLVKTSHSKDITKEGSRNVGTLNALKVSGSKKIGILVLVIDFLKGAVPVFLLAEIFNCDIETLYIASIFLLLGHNFPVWLKFKGGRGLAAGAGIFAVLNYWILFSWCLVWVILKLFRQSILISNFIATIALPLFAIVFDMFDIITTISAVNSTGTNLFVLFVICISLIVIIRHTEVIGKLFPSAAKNINK
jgi:acyl phosphate:glycerol-3-phosphate acyltransferase